MKDQLKSSIMEWKTHMTGENKSAEFDLLLKEWPPCDVIALLAADNSIDKYNLVRQLQNAESLKFRRREIRTVATYYPSLANGGIERVLSSLCTIWTQMGYQVVLITENQNNGEEYSFPQNVKRVYIPDFRKYRGEKYNIRAQAIKKCIEENRIDVVVYHAWLYDILLWDEMVIKTAGAAFVVYCHGMFTTRLIDPSKDMKGLVTPIPLVDAVVTLSSIDCSFWNHFNNNVFQVINPFTKGSDQWGISDCSSHNILWLGRISEEKRPFDALLIIKSIIKHVPDAKLHIVGSCRDKNYERKFQQSIIDMGISDNVILHGFQIDVEPYFLHSSVFLLTSDYEGYGMVLQESMQAGLPIVMYDLPHLTLVKNNPGIISVPQHDIECAAEKIVTLLRDEEKRKEIGREGRQFIRTLMGYDYVGAWKEIFGSLGKPQSWTATEDERLMMDTLILHYDRGLKDMKGATQFIGRKTVRLAIRMVKIKDCLHENGFLYTLRKVRAKFQ